MATQAAKAGAPLVPVTDQSTRHQLTPAIDRAAVVQEGDLAYEDEFAAWTGRSHLAQARVFTASTPSTASAAPIAAVTGSLGVMLLAAGLVD